MYSQPIHYRHFALNEHCSSDNQSTPTSGINMNPYWSGEIIIGIVKNLAGFTGRH